jgi:uncharacterized phage infection (PIP) family protein YhgE
MEFRHNVEEVFAQLKALIQQTCASVKSSEDKDQIEYLTKSLARSFYSVKQLTKQVDSDRDSSKFLYESLKSAEKQLSDQESLKSSLNHFLTN